MRRGRLTGDERAYLLGRPTAGAVPIPSLVRRGLLIEGEARITERGAWRSYRLTAQGEKVRDLMRAAISLRHAPGACACGWRYCPARG